MSDNKILEVEESIGAELMRALYDQVTTLRTPWIVTPRQQQQDVLDNLRAAVEQAVHSAVKRLSTAGFEYVVAEIDSLTIKDDAKAAIVLPRGTQDIHALADHPPTTNERSESRDRANQRAAERASRTADQSAAVHRSHRPLPQGRPKAAAGNDR